MTHEECLHNDSDTSRRSFPKGLAATAGVLALTGRVDNAFAAAQPMSSAPTAAAAGWADQIGLELYTVRDLTPKDYLGTLEKVAAIGYKEIEPAGGYGNMSPKQFRAALDRLGLKMPSTHSGITAGPTPDLERRLAEFQIMGIAYTELSQAPPPNAPPRAGRNRGPAATSPAEQRKQMAQFIQRMAQPRTADDVKQEAARYNTYGKIAQHFGIKLLIHNHTVEFIPCKDGDEVPYSILLRETDPELVVFQLDIGWSSVAGQNAIELFQAHPGRFALWHVKDVACLKYLNSLPDQGSRMAEAQLVPVGNGDVDYGEIFKYANVAGMKHFVIEQDSAAEWGDSIAAARVSYEHLRSTLTNAA